MEQDVDLSMGVEQPLIEFLDVLHQIEDAQFRFVLVHNGNQVILLVGSIH
jgi:hypothetical protein